ncbi:MAG TPA: dTDP-4-amino-4,6-dideoxygalactose transaminase [Bacteroidales bacterium]|nr:dTDP-4-amino-4,6-dideoxygalactose transaminase [Bacteroidales bacterium]
MQKIPFNKPYITGKEVHYIYDAFASGKISGNGKYTQLCQSFFESKYGFTKTLLTTSCTDALEMCALLLNIKADDEIIMPSFTFVSTALAFVRQGAKIIFVDSSSKHPGIDEDQIENLITNKTKAIVVVHYAGVACNMDKIIDIANRYGLYVVEDAAQAIDSFFISKDGNIKPLGSIGHLGCFSFHETKNLQCGEGGMLIINDNNFIKRAEIIWEKGTNRAEFFRGEVNKYGWIDIGSSFLPSDILAAFLYAQIENLENIQAKRKYVWNFYYENLKELANKGYFRLPYLPEYATNNAHMFYLVCNSFKERSQLINYLNTHSIFAVSHYQSLHKSKYYKNLYNGKELINSDAYTDKLIRLPLFFELCDDDLNHIVNTVHDFFK